ncbi:hypothetical protein [Teredinibacter sp. KSP-S5-2]|uniref:hypothetical protein n=1 Tax=Teredinibacter sp. KSP-S5-2 TaxID=3034506 RepID=UPI00293463F6|nr:hypothetical protein [Teredinibacter sp. KSP-S5-2]WNO08343.1 hypothetical protein P5V12_15335 [Teredinibacter sp. KSP-S5-2]
MKKVFILLSLLCSITTGASAYSEIVQLNPQVILFPILDLDYLKECNVRRSVHNAVHTGNLTLNTAADVEKYRCVKEVTGNLTIDLDNKITIFYLPWLEKVGGKLSLEAGAYFNVGKFSKLHTVSGSIVINNRPRSAHWWFPALKKHNGTLEVVAGVLNDLTGFESLEYLGKLYLRTHPNDIWGPFKFFGLDVLTKMGRLEYSLREGEVSGSFLSQLVQVESNVDIQLRNSSLFGLGSIQSIGGRLKITQSDWVYNLNNLASLQEIGSLYLDDNPSLNNVNALNNVDFPANGYLKITNNGSLANCDAKTLVRNLRQSPNWNSFNGSNTYVYGNGYPDCN